MLSYRIVRRPGRLCCVPAGRPDQTEETCAALPLCLRVYCKHRITSRIPQGQATSKQTGESAESGLTGWKTVEAGASLWSGFLSEGQHRTTSEGLWFGELSVDQTSLICSRRPPPLVLLPELPATWTHFITAIRELASRFEFFNMELGWTRVYTDSLHNCFQHAQLFQNKCIDLSLAWVLLDQI